MTQASVGVPITPSDVGQKAVDCETIVVNGVTYYRQRVSNVQQDGYGNEVLQMNSAFGEQVTVGLSPQWQQSFEYTVSNTELNENTVTGSGTVTQANAMANVSTGTTTGSNAMLQSAHHAKYRAGCGMMLRFSARYTAPVAGTFQYLGMVDEHGSTAEFKNGFMIGFNGTAVVISRFANDIQYDIQRADWNDPLDGTGFSGADLDFQKLNVFYIQAQYLGAGAIKFWVENPATGIPFVFHTLLYANLNTVPSTYNPNYHMTIYADNGATTSNLTVYCGSYGYFVEGMTELIELHQPQFTSGSKTKTNVTTEVAIFTILNKTVYAGRTNYIDIMLERIGAAIEASAANNLGTVRLVRNATLGGTPSFTDINTTNAVAAIDVAG